MSRDAWVVERLRKRLAMLRASMAERLEMEKRDKLTDNFVGAAFEGAVRLTYKHEIEFIESMLLALTGIEDAATLTAIVDVDEATKDMARETAIEALAMDALHGRQEEL